MSQDRRYRHTGPVGFLRLFFRGRGWLAAVLTSLAIILHSALAWDAYQVDRFNAQADRATATVMRIIADQALVRYETPQGSFAQRIPARSAQPGDRIEVYYTADSPAEIRRTLRRHLPLTGWFQIIATGIGLLGLWLGWSQGIAAVRKIQTRRYGVIEQVEVTRIEDDVFSKRSVEPAARLHWKRSDGTFGVSDWQAKLHLAQWSSGDTTEIYVWRGHTYWHDDLGGRQLKKSWIPSVQRKL